MITEGTKSRTQFVPFGVYGNDDFFEAVTTAYNSSTTNAASIDRISASKLSRFDAQIQKNLESFVFDLDTVYVITNYPPNPFREDILEYFEQDRSPLKMFLFDDMIVIR